MWPDLVTLGTPDSPVTVHSYGLLVLLAFMASLGWVHTRAGVVGLPQDRVAVLDVAAAIGGVIGAKVLYAVALHDPSALTSSGGFAWYGGVLGGMVAVVVIGWLLQVDLWKLADVVAPALAIGATLGRAGCWFAGCCHGVPVPVGNPGTALLPDGLLHGQVYLHHSFPWLSNAFDGGAARWTHVPLYPTQLWQAAGSALLAGVLIAVSQRRRFDGQVFAVWLLLDPVLRAVVESFRGDTRGLLVAWQGQAPGALPGLGSATAQAGEYGMTTSQGIGVALVFSALLLMVMRWGSGVKPEIATNTWGDDLIDEP